MKRLGLLALLAPLHSTGQYYFQQEVDYTINVRLDDERHVLHAHESFVYRNNSPTALDTVWIHLWPNAYKERGTALCEQLNRMGELDLHFAQERDRGSIDSLDFTVDGAKAAWGFHPRHIDIGWVKVPAPIQPGASVTISTPFRVKIPDGRFSRLGHSEQAYYITQWYPKPAVYDAQGWHAMPYLTQGEFYSEFGSFDVTITLPANYVVGATGICQTDEERAWMDSLSTAPSSDQRTKAEFQRERFNVFPPSSPALKTIRYMQDRVHDFAWFADKRFIVRKGSIELPKSGREVMTWVMFTPKNALKWSDAVSYVNESVRFYSEHVGDYPYDACTAVDGTISAGGGMEYPMITVIGNMPDKQSLDNVIAHEVGHNWFYGILGSNERDHAWMDEGMNSFLELRYMRARYPGNGFTIGIPGLKKATTHLSDPHRAQSELAYRLNARRNLDQRLSLSSGEYTTMNYGTMVYMKTALVMDHLLAYLGEETMDKCLHTYFDEWRFKHPQPEDMRKVFERESGKDLGWVFSDVLRSSGKPEVKARWIREGRLRFVEKGARAQVPIPVSAWWQGDSLGTVWLEADTALLPLELKCRTKAGKRAITTEWTEAPAYRRTENLPWKEVDRIRIDAGNRTLDIDRRNNEVRAHGLFKRCAPLKFESMLGIERNDRRSIYYSLLPAWNGHDGWQAGLALRNTTFPSQRTEWVVAPLYAFGSERLVGSARIEHHFDRIRSTVFRNIHLGFGARSSSTFHDHHVVAWYEKYSPSIRFDMKRPLSKPWSHAINLRGVRIYNTSEVTGNDAVLYRYRTFDDYLELQHFAEDPRKLHPSAITTTLTAGEDWLRGAIEAKQAFAYNEKGKQLRLRAFASSFFVQNPVTRLEAWGLSWGPEDMLYDHAYFERGARDRYFSRQFNKQQGGFKTPFRQGGSDTWIASVNMELDFPFKLPIAAFASAGWVPITTITPDGRSTSTATYVEAGIGVPVVKDVLEVWIPVYVSERIADEEDFLERSFGDRIRFVLALEKLDPTRFVRSIRP